MLPIASNILVEYFSSYSVFKYNRAKYFIELRHYGTSAVRNYLFHKFGGTYSCCTQINIQQIGVNGFYLDTDFFLSFGNKSTEWVFDYGARINHIAPVGSVAMEYRYFNDNVNRAQKQKYDIVYLGAYIYGGLHFLDTYSTFMDDYYDSFRWLADFSKKNPQLRIGIKKPLKGIIDKMERDIIKNTPIEYIDQRFNSYEVAFQAKCAVTYGSTMGYELLGHGVPVLYIDPGRRNLFLPVRGDLSLEPYRVTDYKDFCQKLETLLSGRFLEGMNNVDKSDFCLDSSKTSEKIYSCLLSGRNKTVQNTIL